MNEQEIMRKAEAGMGLTVEGIQVYQRLVKPIKHVYGKYGTLAKKVSRRTQRRKILVDS